ncbi:uncharacterized protein A4U43_C03F480 [Asparagus officinalis]|uniref:Hexosyltransferase n=1 Tax=Asparagus officinalis TaxID=4686 RepID=A0A5P1F659_ASPOF|nr:uncharacterized protein A4U43_C03F480 [Asparagus officinalis]
MAAERPLYLRPPPLLSSIPRLRLRHLTLSFLASLSVILSSHLLLPLLLLLLLPPLDLAGSSRRPRRSVVFVLSPELGVDGASSPSAPPIPSAPAYLLPAAARPHPFALVHAYSSLARRSKLSSSRSLSIFQDLSSSFSQLASKISSSSSSNLDDDSLRLLEKEAKEKIKTARQIISESKESFDTQLKIQKLRDTIFAVNEQLNKAKKLGSLSSQIAAGSTPKSIHCLNMRLMGDWINNPKKYKKLIPNPNSPALINPDLYHYAIFSDNVIAVSVVVNSAVKSAKEPRKHVFHVVTDKMYVAAMSDEGLVSEEAAGARCTCGCPVGVGVWVLELVLLAGDSNG